MKYRMFECAIVWHPNLRQEEAGAASKIVVPPVALLAKDEASAQMLVGRKIPGDSDLEENQMEVLVRPFV